MLEGFWKTYGWRFGHNLLEDNKIPIFMQIFPKITLHIIDKLQDGAILSVYTDVKLHGGGV
jgi:hypothetical protein